MCRDYSRSGGFSGLAGEPVSGFAPIAHRPHRRGEPQLGEETPDLGARAAGPAGGRVGGRRATPGPAALSPEGAGVGGSPARARLAPPTPRPVARTRRRAASTAPP